MTSEVLSCCCGPGFCCPCNPLYGGRTSWQVTWSGSITATPNLACSCIQQWATPLGNGYGEAFMLTRSYTVGGAGFASTWINTTDPMNAQFCGMSSYTDPIATAPMVYGRSHFILLPNGPCSTDPSFPEQASGIRLRSSVSVYPPVFPCPTNTLTQPTPWIVRATVIGVAAFTFRGSTSCTSPGPFVLDLSQSSVDGQVPQSASGTMGCASVPLPCSLTWSAGTASVS